MKLYWVDAFADRLFAGNPAAVCYAPEWPGEELMQRIAAENNLPETAFVVRENDGYGIRWFTPKYEIDLCGHATLASAFVIHHFVDEGVPSVKFRSQSGELSVACGAGIYTLDSPARPAPAVGRVEGAEEALGISVQEFYLSRDLIAVVEDEEAVRRLNPDFSKLLALGAGDGVIVTAPGRDCDFVSRCFFPKSGVDEDPVTGSAHCNLIPYWSKRLSKERLCARQLSQRGGELDCRWQGGDRVYISGSAVLYAVADLRIS